MRPRPTGGAAIGVATLGDRTRTIAPSLRRRTPSTTQEPSSMTISETPTHPSPSPRAGALPSPGGASLLQRVILPRSGDPMSVRSLYMDERNALRLTTVPDPLVTEV